MSRGRLQREAALAAFAPWERELAAFAGHLEFQQGYAWLPAQVTSGAPQADGDGEYATGRYLGPGLPALAHGAIVRLYPGAIRRPARASPAVPGEQGTVHVLARPHAPGAAAVTAVPA